MMTREEFERLAVDDYARELKELTDEELIEHLTQLSLWIESWNSEYKVYCEDDNTP